jgi:hypothetical protein
MSVENDDEISILPLIFDIWSLFSTGTQQKTTKSKFRRFYWN